MKKQLFLLAICFSICEMQVYSQQQICVAPTAVGYATGAGMANACDISSLPSLLQFITTPEVYVYFAGGDYYDVSLNLSGLDTANHFTTIHLMGGVDPQYNGYIDQYSRDWQTFPTVFHADDSNPYADVINIDHFWGSTTYGPSSVESIIITSDNNTMYSNAIHLLAGYYSISDCHITEYNTLSRLLMIEVGSYDAYIVNTLIDNNDSWSLLGSFGKLHLLNTTIADNNHSYFIDGMTTTVNIFNSILWGNSNLYRNSTFLTYARFLNSFIETSEPYMYDAGYNVWRTNPLFTYDNDDPYTCSSLSPIINHGDGTLLTNSGLPDYSYIYDVAQNERFYDFAETVVDAGAYQHFYDGDSDKHRPERLPGKHTSGSDIKIWAYQNTVFVDGLSSEYSTLTLYNMFGLQVYVSTIYKEYQEVPIFIQAGEYIATITSASGEKLLSETIYLH